MAKIRAVSDRAKLIPRNAPYFVTIETGCSLGVRVLTPGSPGTWIARWYDPETRQRHTRSLGALDHLQPSARYDAALKLAREWWQHLKRGGTTDVVTVAEVCALYVASIRREGRTEAADEQEKRFAQYVNNTPLAKVELEKLLPKHIEAWRNDRQDTPTRSGAPRGPATLNRDMVCLRAALNYALQKRMVYVDVWSAELKPAKGADKRRDLYLDAGQRERLTEAARSDLQPFLRALCLVPLRVGAMAALTVGDYDQRLNTITVRKDKAAAGRKITLPDATAQLFADNCKDKLPGAPLFARWDGVSWANDRYKHVFKEAALAADMPAGTVAYTLRHSVITDLIVSGADPLTVALISGTSLVMIQRHYGHLTAQAATAALGRLAT